MRVIVLISPTPELGTRDLPDGPSSLTSLAGRDLELTERRNERRWSLLSEISDNGRDRGRGKGSRSRLISTKGGVGGLTSSYRGLTSDMPVVMVTVSQLCSTGGAVKIWEEEGKARSRKVWLEIGVRSGGSVGQGQSDGRHRAQRPKRRGGLEKQRRLDDKMS